jgi:hypothetical protein
MDRITLLIVVGAVLLLVSILELVRRRKLEEQYSLLWLAMAVSLVALALTRTVWDWVLPSLGIAYPPTALFVAGFIALLLILMHFSTVVSKLTHQNRQAAQEIGYLRWKLNELEKKLNDQQPTP